MADREPGTSADPGVRTETGPVVAAGAVLWRAGANGHPEIALVHRPRYDDWSLPKGKLRDRETTQQAAVREVIEETGFDCVLSRMLARESYSVPSGNGEWTTKQVDYFSARARGGAFVSNAEVDEIEWLNSARARQRLSYRDDARVLDAFESQPTDLSTLLLVRHAKAGKRSDWSGDDDLRPLSDAGERQRAALRVLLPLFAPERVYSAPRVRCVQTVSAVAEDLGVPIGPEPLLSEEGYWPNPRAGADRLLRIAAGTGTAVVSSQGGVIPDLVARLGRAGGLALEDEVPSRKGSVWTLTFRRDEYSSNGSGPEPHLVAADYLPDPLAPGTVPHST